jgi:hypothetical protein
MLDTALLKYYRTRIDALKLDIDHINLKIQLTDDPDEVIDLRQEKARILSARLDYIEAAEKLSV